MYLHYDLISNTRKYAIGNSTKGKGQTCDILNTRRKIISSSWVSRVTKQLSNSVLHWNSQILIFSFHDSNVLFFQNVFKNRDPCFLPRKHWEMYSVLHSELEFRVWRGNTSDSVSVVQVGSIATFFPPKKIYPNTHPHCEQVSCLWKHGKAERTETIPKLPMNRAVAFQEVTSCLHASLTVCHPFFIFFQHQCQPQFLSSPISQSFRF